MGRKDLFRDLPLPCLTCEAVLSEAFFRLRKDEQGHPPHWAK